MYDNNTSYLYYDSKAPPLLVRYFQRVYLSYYVAPSVTDSGQPAIRIVGYVYADGNSSKRVGNREIFVYLDNSSDYYEAFVTDESSTFNISIALPAPSANQVSVTHTLTLKWLRAGEHIELEGGKVTVRIIKKNYLSTLLLFSEIPSAYYSGATALFYLSLVYFGAAVALTARTIGLYIIKKRREEQKRRKIRSIRNKVLDVLSLVDPEKAEEINQKRLKIWQNYYDGLKELEEKKVLRLPIIPDDCQHNAHMFYIILRDEKTRNDLMDFLKKEKNILSVFHYVPLHSAPMGKKTAPNNPELPITNNLSGRILRLPFYYNLTIDEQNHIINSVKYYNEK